MISNTNMCFHCIIGILGIAPCIYSISLLFYGIPWDSLGIPCLYKLIPRDIPVWPGSRLVAVFEGVRKTHITKDHSSNRLDCVYGD